jgi:arylsulfatase A-like enzyme
MRPSVAALCALLLVAVPRLALAARFPVPMPSSAPNILVFYLDDVAPHDGRLWSDPAITPALYDLFVAHGVTFTNAIGETPLCCPGRTGLLTGLHTQNTGVIDNNAQLFHPEEHIGWELKDSGYDTVLIGKYLNLAATLTGAQWAQHAAGWTELDAFRSNPFRYSNFTLFTKEGNVKYQSTDRTQMVADRAVQRLSEADPSQPVFAILSVHDLHVPNTAMPRFVGDPRCAHMPPWDPPNYNEADVSDKPPLIQALPLLPYANGWPMVTYCEEMLGEDWLVQQVEDELKAEGRLDNTLFIFTADNGMAWGQHRLGEEKLLPYTTPVPLMMSWPARWGDQPRTIDDVVSNIDIAPTLCDIVGCTLGPYPTGQQHPDGVSLLPLLDGSVHHLARDAVLERNWKRYAWSAIRTTSQSPLGQWHYIEYDDGFRELYDSVNDPWELNNLAYDQGYGPLIDALSARLGQVRQQGVVTKPDGSIGRTRTGAYVGDGIYDSLPSPDQTEKVTGARRRSSYSFWINIDNDNGSARSFMVSDLQSGTKRMKVHFFVDGIDVTTAVDAGTYVTPSLASGATASLTVQVHVGKRARISSRKRVTIDISSSGVPGLIDAVRAVVVR